MDNLLRGQVETRLQTLRPGASIQTVRRLSGGCIHQAYRLQLQDGFEVFLKANPQAPPDMFAAEWTGLEALANTQTLRIPQPLAVDPQGRFLLLEYLPPGDRPRDFFEIFGRRFAAMHRSSQRTPAGFSQDNYIGSTRQINTPGDDWIAFWREHRLGYQLKLARQNGFDGALQKLGEKLRERLADWLGPAAEPCCLLHGDLWSGNFLDAGGQPALIDPATYYGHREADLAMTRMFGGFAEGFYRAYQEAWPLSDGAEERLQLYQLYHWLNHLNLFGGGYLENCLAILRRFVGTRYDS